MIPEGGANILGELGFAVLPDADAHDYVYSVESLASMNSWLGHRSSRGIKNFLKAHPDYSIKIFPLKEIHAYEYIKIFDEWAKLKNLENHFESNEYRAFRRFLELEVENIEVVSLYVNNELIGFTAYEVISSDYAIAHFSKANVEHHSAIYDILNWEEAKSLYSKGIRYYNWEQDLGMNGLRDSKMKYKPCHFLKKFIVKQVN